MRYKHRFNIQYNGNTTYIATIGRIKVMLILQNYYY